MKQSGWLIYSQEDAKRNRSYIEWLIKEAQLQDLSLSLVLRENLSIGIMNNQQNILLNGSPIEPPSFAVIRTPEPMLNLFLENCGVSVFNSSAISRLCNHKAKTHYEINKLGIPMVDTYFLKRTNLQNSPPLPYPFVIKESVGRSGKQVYFIQSDQDWKASTDQFTSPDLIIQSSDVQLGKDVRVFIIGKEIIGAVMRISTVDFRANFGLGGKAKWYPLNDDERYVIEKIVQTYDFDLVGIDFLIDQNGNFLFNEIEDVVGSRILSATSNINLLEKYVSHIKEVLNKK